MVDPAALAHELMHEFNGGDAEMFASRFAEDAEWLPVRSATEGAYRGPAGVREWMSETKELFDRIEASIDQVESRGESVLLTGQLSLRGRGSGASVELPIFWVFRLSGETIAYGRAHTDREEALADFETR